ncbi:hypothetical protein AVEN_246310-1 [Araneus ventricosus]|uniref:Uncharacterized protein n=1 Tax=Araneus ventricosus TaxID=182803 RepID=A0A4Y2WKY0_ARAVE|nr:hypothetical protein AVEN_246310-1 [Araneus ventricosus]
MNEALWNYSAYAVKQFASILPTGNMKNCYFFSACFFGFLTTIYAVGRVNPACLEKEKAIALLETAQNFLTKAEVSFPSCMTSKGDLKLKTANERNPRKANQEYEGETRIKLRGNKEKRALFDREQNRGSPKSISD